MTDCPTKSDCDSNTSTTDTERREIVGLFPKLDLTEVFTEYGHLSSGAIIDLILEKQHQIPCKRGTACSFAIGVSAWWPRWLGGRVFRIMLSSIKAKVTGVPSVKECMECTVCWESATVEELCFCDGTTTVTSSTSSSSNDGQQNTIVTLSNETHAFCRQCLERHALATVEEMPLAKGGLGLRCMVNDCENPITFQEIQTFMSPSMVQRLEERCAELSVVQANLSYMERCRSCNCAVELGASPAVLQVFRCPECRLQFCRLCDEEWQDEHKGISCEQFGKQQNRERLLEKRLSEAVVRNCLKCKVAFVKHDGCNRVTCRCGANQCYICRENDIDYDHFCRCFREKIPPKLPFKCSKCGKGCLLWQRAEPVEKQQMERIRREMEEEEKAKAKKRLGTGTAAPTSSTSSSSRIPVKNKGKVVVAEKPCKTNGKESQEKRRLPPELLHEVFLALPYQANRQLLLLRNPTVYHRASVQRQRRRNIDALVTRGVLTWTVEEVSRWVNFVTRSDSNGDRFVEEEIDGSALILLDEKTLSNNLNFLPGTAIELWSALVKLKLKHIDDLELKRKYATDWSWFHLAQNVEFIRRTMKKEEKAKTKEQVGTGTAASTSSTNSSSLGTGTAASTSSTNSSSLGTGTAASTSSTNSSSLGTGTAASTSSTNSSSLGTGTAASTSSTNSSSLGTGTAASTSSTNSSSLGTGTAASTSSTNSSSLGTGTAASTSSTNSSSLGTGTAASTSSTSSSSLGTGDSAGTSTSSTNSSSFGTGTAAPTSSTSSSSRIPVKNKGKVVVAEKPCKTNGKVVKK
uniref:RING-type domain-containing protein n=1 Tax=Globodera rostochiensis TaxID=31243 RepID=A0A914GPM2_GLORO